MSYIAAGGIETIKLKDENEAAYDAVGKLNLQPMTMMMPTWITKTKMQVY
jgi:hypothetical protein